jgi:hypothetical protein
LRIEYEQNETLLPGDAIRKKISRLDNLFSSFDLIKQSEDSEIIEEIPLDAKTLEHLTEGKICFSV